MRDASRPRIPAGSAEHLDSIAVILEEFISLQEDDQSPDIETFCARHPVALREQIRKGCVTYQRVQGILDELEPVGSETPSEGRLGDFKLLREVGRGGMGIVYEAEQISLGRRVAVKVLPFAAVLDDKQIERFHNEAQAAARLHHTNIVPVYSVGCERGVHFYAMQYIEGRTLAEAIQELRELSDPTAAERESSTNSASGVVQGLLCGRWSDSDDAPTGRRTSSGSWSRDSTRNSTSSATFFRSVAQLGVQVAEAMDHAHQQGVVHRDIKPSNLIIDARGSIWITDFGLARLEGSPELTMTGDVLGTIRYMSPEQALAKRVLIDHRSDIYSLGVTLYELLTLRCAFEGTDRQELFRKVAFEEPRQPRKIDRTIPVELETILLEAMAKNPAERYDTAQDMADDLSRFLQDKPILARPPTLIERSAKWCRRHKTVVAAGAAILLVSLIALTASTILITIEKGRTEIARAEAEANFETADANLDKAMAAVDEMLTEVSAVDLLNVPRMDAVRRRLLEKALAFYLGFLEEKSTDPVIRLRTASAFRKVGDIRNDLGEPERAEEAFNRGMELLWAPEDSADDPLMKWELAGMYSGLASSLDSMLRLDEAEAAVRKSLELYGQLVADFPEEVRYRFSLTSATREFGLALANQYGPREEQECEDAFRRALELAEDMLAESPLNSAYLKLFVDCSTSLASVFDQSSRQEEAEATCRRGLAVERTLTAGLAADPNLKHAVAESYRVLGGVLRNIGRRPQEAEEAVRTALEYERSLLTDFPERVDFALGAADAYVSLSVLLADTGRLREAGECARHAADFLDPLAADTPGISKALLTKTLLHLGRVFLASEHRKEAEDAVRKALGIQEELVALGDQRSKYQMFLGELHLALSKILGRGKTLDEAESLLRRAIVLYGELAAEFHYKIDVRVALARSWGALGTVLTVTDRVEDAEEAYRQALQLYRRLAEDFPDVPRVVAAQSRCWSDLGGLLRKLGRVEEAEAAYRTAMDGGRRMVFEYPDDFQHRQSLVTFHHNLAAILLNEVGPPDEAVDALREVIKALHEVMTEWPEGFPERNKQMLGSEYHALGVLLESMGRLAEAEETFSLRIELGEQWVAENPEVSFHRVGLIDFYGHLIDLLEASSRFQEAEQASGQRLIHQQKLADDSPQDANAQNGLAWFLVTTAYAGLRDPSRAVELAERAVAAAPDDGNSWNTLGVARYYAGRFDAAIEALERSMELRSGGDANDWFILAMTHWELGAEAEARRWHERSVEWMGENPSNNQDLLRFRDEAKELLDRDGLPAAADATRPADEDER